VPLVTKTKGWLPSANVVSRSPASLASATVAGTASLVGSSGGAGKPSKRIVKADHGHKLDRRVGKSSYPSGRHNHGCEAC